MVNREHAIEDAIIKNPGAIGFPQAGIIRNARVSRHSGRVDLMILPTTGLIKLALVEAKHVGAPDAASKVIGQLIMYYTAALQIGAEGLCQIRDFADSNPGRATDTGNTSLIQLAGGARSQDEAWTMLQGGRKLKPKDLALFLALDADPQPKLVDSLRLLRKHHRLDINIILANTRKVRVMDY